MAAILPLNEPSVWKARDKGSLGLDRGLQVAPACDHHDGHREPFWLRESVVENALGHERVRQLARVAQSVGPIGFDVTDQANVRNGSNSDLRLNAFKGWEADIASKHSFAPMAEI
jgi:hypothetical protein